MKSKELEILVRDIQKQMSPDAEVLHNVNLPSRTTSAKRQIDVLVRQRIGQYEMLIVIDAKDYQRPVDIKGVEEFYGLLTDVGANKGVLVCPSGFSNAAKERASNWLIDLYSPVDTGDHKWKVKVSIPTICDFRTAKLSFSISCSAPLPLTLAADFYNSLSAFDANNQDLGLPRDLAINKWNKGGFPVEPGVHQDVNLFEQEEVFVDNGHGTQVPVKMVVSLYVEQQLYYGQMPISKISGFKNEISNHVITNAFEIGLLDPNNIVDNWKPISKDEVLPMPPVLTLMGLVGWS